MATTERSASRVWEFGAVEFRSPGMWSSGLGTFWLNLAQVVRLLEGNALARD